MIKEARVESIKVEPSVDNGEFVANMSVNGYVLFIKEEPDTTLWMYYLDYPEDHNSVDKQTLIQPRKFKVIRAGSIFNNVGMTYKSHFSCKNNTDTFILFEYGVFQ